MACEAECRAFLTIQADIFIYILRKPAGKLASCCLRTK